MVEQHDHNGSVSVDLAEKEGAESQQKFDFLLELCNDGILIVQDGKIKESNHLMAKMCGYAVDEVLDTEFASFFHPDDIAQIERICAAVIGDANAIEVHDITPMCKNGLKLQAEITAGHFVYNQHPAVLFIVRDISDRIRSENARAKSRKLDSITALSGGIAHDYNNLLTAIIGNISLAQVNLSPEHKAFILLSQALAASKTAKHLTRKLITFSKDGAPDKTAAAVSQLVMSATEFTLSGSNVKSFYNFADDLWSLNVDKIQVGQAIYNIVMNAREAMPKGGVLKVGAENVSLKPGDKQLPQGRYVKIYFEDHGKGIPKKCLDNIFDPYFSTKNRDTRNGPGLGLSICQSIIKNHGGDMTVESALGKGTQFHIYLPAADAQPADDISGKSEETEISIFGNGRILVMDDEMMIRELSGRILTHLGYDVEFAENGSEAADLYKNAMQSPTPFDGVILDLTVRGGMGGKEAIKKILEIDPHVNAVISSGYSTDPCLTDFRQYGFKGIIAKPYTLEDISATLNQVM